MQWLLLDSDKAHYHKLAEQVFKKQYGAFHNLTTELESPHEAHLIAISIIGLVFFRFSAGTSDKCHAMKSV